MASLAPGDFYYEGKRMVFTEQFHLRRGWCCRAGCRHCPWQSVCPIDQDKLTGSERGRSATPAATQQH